MPKEPNIGDEDPNNPRNWDRNYLRAMLRESCEKKLTKFEPRDWQLDIACDIIQGKSGIVLAGTGKGKSLPFILPGLITTKTALVFSPLNALEEDQAWKFSTLGFRALGLNSVNSNKAILQKIKDGEYEAVFTSPELVLDSSKWRDLIASPEFQNIWGLIAVDEVHCMLSWGFAQNEKKPFRPAWGRLHEVKALIPSSVPWLMVTAMLASYEIPLVRSRLLLPDDIKITNLGNDRPQIFYQCQQVLEQMKTFKDITNLVVPEPGQPLKSTMIFFDNRKTPHEVHEQICKLLAPTLHYQVAVFHSLRSELAKKEVMKKFRDGEIRILLCTEAAGMGCDIPHVELVIQWRVPNSLSIWLQRSGRAARDPNITAKVVLLVPSSWYQKVKEYGLTKESCMDRSKFSKDEAEATIEAIGCDLPMCLWVLNPGCRRVIADILYNNPVRRGRPPFEGCCDNCAAAQCQAVYTEPETPVNQVFGLPPKPQSTHHSISDSSSQESVSPVANGKRKRQQKAVRKQTRKIEHRLELEMEILTWREAAWRMIQKILKDLTISNAKSLQNVWRGSGRFADEVLAMICEVDWKYFRQNEQAGLTKLWRKVSKAAAQRGKAQMAQARKESMLMRRTEKAALQVEREAKKAASKAASSGERDGRKGRGGRGRGSSTRGRMPLKDLNGPLNLPGMGVFSLQHMLSPYSPMTPQRADSVAETPLHGVVLDLNGNSQSFIEDSPRPLTTQELQRTDSNPFLTPAHSGSFGYGEV